MTTSKKSFPIDLDREMLLSLDSCDVSSSSSSSSSSESALSSPDTELSLFQFSSKSSSLEALPDLVFLGQRTPAHSRTPNNSPASLDVSVTSLITVSDDTTTTDSFAATTLPGTTVTWAGRSACTHTHTQDYSRWDRYGKEDIPQKGDVKVADGREHLLSTLAPSGPPLGAFKPKVALRQSASTADGILLPSVSEAGTSVVATADSLSSKYSLSDDSDLDVSPSSVFSGSRELDFRDRMCNKEKKACSGGVVVPSASAVMPNAQSVCSRACAEKFTRLSKDLNETNDKLLSLALQVEEQASHIAKLTEENRRYILENGRMKKNHWPGTHAQESPSYGDMYNERAYADHGDTTELEDKIMALQLQNSELSVCLEREKRLRKEAENRLQRDMGYIKRLEDSVQTLRGTRVIMDPSTYRQVAEAYMAAKRTPTRRPHTHSGVPGSDLVCDATQNNSSGSRQRLSHPVLHHTSSCPSSKDSVSAPTSKSMYSSIEYPQVANSLNKSNKRDHGVSRQDLNRGYGIGTNSMNPWDYQQLLESLEDLNGSSKGALS